MNAPSNDAGDQVQLASRLLYFCPQSERGLTPRAYQMLIMRRPELRQLEWTLKHGAPRDLQHAVANRAALAELDFDAWTAGFTKA